MVKKKDLDKPLAQIPDVNPKPINKMDINVECPKVYGGSISLNTCTKCPSYAGLKENKILCQFEDEEGKTIRPDNKLNELSGSEWLYFTKTVLRTSFPSEFGHELRKKHFANKPPQLMKHLIEFFSKSNHTVLDPFAGVGGTLLGASLCNRKCTGIEINQEWIDIYREVCKNESLSPQEVFHGDCLSVMAQFKKEGRQFDLIATDPPYSPALEKTMCDEKYGMANRKSNFESFSDTGSDFRNSKTFDEFYQKMDEAGKLMYAVLKEGKYLIMIIRDSYQNSEYIPASTIVAERYSKYFTFKGIKIWYATGAPVRPYGYPAVYVPNIIHHNILIFRKESKKEKENCD
jgi:DNA modification methylase